MTMTTRPIGWLRELRTAAIAVLTLGIIVCALYPAAVWIAAQILFPAKAGGSLVVRNGSVLGSTLIGQNFSGPGFFHSRPSAAGSGYDSLHSGGGNLGPTSKALDDLVRRRVAEYRGENGLGPTETVPVDAVTASGSGLDPHISVRNAELQASRVARSRGMPEADVRRLIAAHVEKRTLGFLGEPRVNVFRLNLALEGRRP
jgi:K+-transporting ATPase ATPase C chain